MDKQKQGRREHLEDTLAGAALDLMKATGSAAYMIPADGNVWVAAGTIEEIAAMAKVCSRTSDRVRRLTFH